MPPDRADDAESFRPTVFLPCHTLDDFPTWLDEAEADDVLAAWTAAWHPCLVAAGGMPRWASADLPVSVSERLLGIVPPPCESRFAAQADATCLAGSRWVRSTSGRDAIAAAAAAAACGSTAGELPGARHAEDFHALGLAVLLSELLARRMRSVPDLEATGLPAAVEAAARAAVAGDDAAATAGLRECFACLEGARDRYYPVQVWLLDLVLVASTTLGRPLAAELEAPVPIGLVMDAALVGPLAAAHPEVLARLRARIAAGAVGPCSGRADGRPLDLCTPEEILESLAAAAAAWRDRVGGAPATFARSGGGSSALLPQVLAGLGCAGAIWNGFDGTPLPDPGAGRIRWEGTGGGAIECAARPPLDARRTTTVLALPERIGDAMDHDHVALVTFAHHAGTASPWHALVRRIGAWSRLLGEFVTPDDLFARTADTGTLVSFEPDAFPPTLPGPAEPLDAAVTATAAAARRIRDAAAELAVVLPPAAAPVPRSPARREPARMTWGRSRGDDLALDNGLVRLEPHRDTGGILALRRSGSDDNRLSQRLAVHDRGHYAGMCADALARGTTASGIEGLVSRGRLLAADGREAGTFTQGMALVPGLPLAVLDLDVELAPAAGPVADVYAACRFAWQENRAVEVVRGLHLQAVVTERTRFTAPHFVEVRDEADVRRGAGDAVAILTGGLPWHVRSSPHVLDSILAAPGPVAPPGACAAARRMAVGIGLERPWDAALALAAGEIPGPTAVVAGTPRVRLTAGPLEREAGRPVRVRVGLVESAGTAGEARVEFAVPVVSATACTAAGGPRPDADVAVEGRTVVVFLRRYEWLHLDLEFGA